MITKFRAIQYVNGELTEIKSWNKSVFGKEAYEELLASLAEIYPGGKIKVDALNGRDRYSIRPGKRTSMTLPSAKNDSASRNSP